MKLGVSLKYQVGGREVSRDEFMTSMRNNFERLAAVRLVTVATERLQSIRCDVHDRAPTVTLVEQTGTQASFRLSDICCDGLKAKAEAAVRKPSTAAHSGS